MLQPFLASLLIKAVCQTQTEIVVVNYVFKVANGRTNEQSKKKKKNEVGKIFVELYGFHPIEQGYKKNGIFCAFS